MYYFRQFLSFSDNTISSDTVSKDTVPKDSVSKDTAPKDTASKEPALKKTVSKNTALKDPVPKNLYGEFAEPYLEVLQNVEGKIVRIRNAKKG